mmetsp:Transcript_1681/g.3762  ORF Transcript_1681/g.3762 Transcript_1681/m.3762 type:complete len:128 (+) Transcript_1681:2-385(+)
MERLAQELLVIPCGVLAAAMAFQLKGMCPVHLEGISVWLLMFLAFAVHIAVHLTALRIIMPWLGDSCSDDHATKDVPYSQVAPHFPGNWFSVNPVHCLRSKYVHGHVAPCAYYLKGKEHILDKPNKP